MMNTIVKNSIIATIEKTYPGVLFISVNMAANVMQLHYQTKVVTDSAGVIDMSERETFLKMLGLQTVEKVHIFVTDKIITFYGDGGKKVNL